MKKLVLGIAMILFALHIGSFLMAQTPEMILVEGDSYLMGRDYAVIGKSGEDVGFEDEIPAHKVTLSDFYIGKYEVTVGEFRKFAENNNVGVSFPINPDDIDYGMSVEDPVTGKDRPKTWYDEYPGVEKWQWHDKHPITNVTWKQAVQYCNWLSEQEGLPVAYKFEQLDLGDDIFEERVVLLDENGDVTDDITKTRGYRLPTEAEWEFAARGGKKSKSYRYAGSNKPGEVAWTDETTYGKAPQQVGLLKANELKIYDMSGNAWEWCFDFYSKDYYSQSRNAKNPTGVSRSLYRSIRGGGWYYMANLARSVVRDGPEFTYTNYNYGFRLARSK